MYLEERVEQLENLSVDQGKQIETIAKGLATITSDMQKGFADIKQEQLKMCKELTSVKGDVGVLKTDVAILKTDVATFRDEVNRKIDHMDQKFDLIISLIKSK